ncbi:uncharacterized protein KNAG_0D01570 [Huiozyma naganishii CBS 8797]|uniref:Respiratory growth induced protein 1 n=1 Tax=Huiozyma naganishii (strain ATCC MYA-139 / BCRC 22969 / CBS 8797 / KCTC 17520 / NBRC 10181 / NCYC 3082 / Yp74L-3) TaxID=1071383 RepID=J7S5L9_HUIN7|nr:hypothetical protein KNAG_0D01570 [Kazachstania naganishii CBS 8797]CCK69909.1 hypothetical protein KNAG_0D01570 [Kazachstania naganishii CBS 8797]
MPKGNKKVKGPKVNTVITKQGEELKVFEDLGDFETYLKNETDDDEFDNQHCQVRYYPPFILQETKNGDPERIKDTANCHSKKFVRHLHHHVEKHLLKEIGAALTLDNLKFTDKSKDAQFDKVTWHYVEKDCFVKDRNFTLQVDVSCTNDTAMVDVDYRTVPVREPPAEEQQQQQNDSLI